LAAQIEIEVVRDIPNVLGECPLWHAVEKALYWVDTRNPAIHRLNSNGAFEVWPMPARLGSLVFRRGGGLIAGMQNGFCAVDLTTGRIEHLVDPEPEYPANRLNDGKCDRRGRYWCGTLDSFQAEPTGSLYRLDTDFSCHKMDTGFITPNGTAFSPDDRKMYFGDSRGETVWVYDFDLDDGVIANRRVFISTRELPGRVDGATIDADGCYWTAMVHDWSVVRWDPKGRMDRRIKLPVRHPTMCGFGGVNLDILYVTTASNMMLKEERRAQPLAGCLFAIHGLGVCGVPEPLFGL
jgi:L-arabinonolactonase